MTDAPDGTTYQCVCGGRHVWGTNPHSVPSASTPAPSIWQRVVNATIPDVIAQEKAVNELLDALTGILFITRHYDQYLVDGALVTWRKDAEALLLKYRPMQAQSLNAKETIDGRS